MKRHSFQMRLRAIAFPLALTLVASVEDEDARREHREPQRLTHERIAHTNPIGSLLVMHNLRPGIVIGGRDWTKWWDAHQEQIPPLLCSEIERENARLKPVKDRVRANESAHRKELAERKHLMVGQLDCVPSATRAHGCWSRRPSAGSTLPTGAN